MYVKYIHIYIYICIKLLLLSHQKLVGRLTPANKARRREEGARYTMATTVCLSCFSRVSLEQSVSR